MKFIVVIAVMVTGGYFFYSHIMPTNQTWLHGTWEYSNLDSPKQDYMTFHPNGTVDLSNAKRTYISCVYFTANDEVSMECDVKGKMKELTYRVSDDRRELINAQFDMLYVKND